MRWNKKRLEATLTRARRIDNEIRDIELRIDELHDIDNLGLDSLSQDEKTGATNNIGKPTESKAVHTADKVAELEYEKRHLQRLKNRIENAIEGLPPTERAIVEMRYIRDEKWFKIAGELNIYERHCRRLNDKALETMWQIGLGDMA